MRKSLVKKKCKKKKSGEVHQREKKTNKKLVVKSLVRKEKRRENVVEFIKEKGKRTNILKKNTEGINSLEICTVVKLKRYQTCKKRILEIYTKKSLNW